MKKYLFDNSTKKSYLLLFFRFIIAKVFMIGCRLLGAAVDFDDLMVFSPSHCNCMKLDFPRLYKFLVLIDK